VITVKTKSYAPVLMGMMLLLTGCAHVSPVPQGLLYPASGVLHLSKGQTYQAQENEVWHSGARYQQLELSYMDAVSALKQIQNK
jgi:hypothetical protein